MRARVRRLMCRGRWPALAALLLAAAVARHTPAAAEEPRKLKLPDLVRLARQRSKGIGVARAELAVRESQRRMAKWLWAPTGELTYGITGTPRIQCRGPSGSIDQDTRERECLNTVDSSGEPSRTVSTGIHGVGMEGEVSLVQPLYTFGKIEAAIEAARHGVAAARAGVDGALGDAELDVTRAYWGAKGARAASEMLSSVRDELVPWVEKIQRDLDRSNPQYSYSDLQRLKTALDEVDVLQANLARTRRVALAGLRALVGEDVDADDEELAPQEPAGRPLGYYLDAAATHRPEVRALGEGAAALHALARLQRAQMLPDIGIKTSVLLRYSSSIDTPNNVFMWQATTTRFGLILGVRQPLDLFQRYAQMKNAQAEAALFEAKRALATTGIEFEVRSVYAGYEEARGRLEATDRGQRTARGWLTAVKQTLDLGIGEPRDLADAGRRYVELRLRYLLAIIDVNISAARLHRATGVD